MAVGPGVGLLTTGGVSDGHRSGPKGPGVRGRRLPSVGGATEPDRDAVRAEPKCPLRPGDDCTLCEPGATGPEDCPAVYLVMSDPDLRSRWVELRRPAS